MSEGSSIGTNESQFFIRVALDRPAALMGQSVVMRAKSDQVVEVGGPTLSPVDSMVTVGPASSLASRKPAALVAMPVLQDGQLYRGLVASNVCTGKRNF